jgi:Flp pilus assembly pilin Flp
MKAQLLAHLFSQLILHLRVDQRGATATEYSVLIAFVVLLSMAGIQLFGLQLNGTYTGLAAGFEIFPTGP